MQGKTSPEKEHFAERFSPRHQNSANQEFRNSIEESSTRAALDKDAYPVYTPSSDPPSSSISRKSGSSVSRNSGSHPIALLIDDGLDADEELRKAEELLDRVHVQRSSASKSRSGKSTSPRSPVRQTAFATSSPQRVLNSESLF